MSLNGLDEPKVVEAHEAGAAEPGGWFLLKYASRDEVELLDRGNGGIVEIRNAIARYDETCPLYGFLRYRRRNVVIKYLPEDCSRLIQARVAVHFNAVCERFSPYDTIFEITVASELKDSKLSAACSLHAASGSTSSSTSSLRRRRLMEIAEEDEEEQRATKRQSLVSETDGERPVTPTDKAATADRVTLNSDLASSPEHSKFSAATTSDVPKFVGVSDGPSSPARSIDTTDSRSYSLYPTSKPKVKLGPRPSLDVIIRPQTAGNFRPVSSIPAGFKLFGKGQKKGKGKDGSVAGSPQEEIDEMNFPNVPTSVAEESTDPTRPATSTGISIATMPLPVPAVTPTKPTMTPEKARLMKAMKLREKKKKMSMLVAPAPASTDTHDQEDEKATAEDVEKIEEEEEEEEDEAEDEDDKEGEEKAEHADSGVVLETLSSSVHTDQASDLTQSDSRAASPVVASSEPDQSTAASSLSESTDETIQAKDLDGQETDYQPKEESASTAPQAEAAGLGMKAQAEQTNVEVNKGQPQLSPGDKDEAAVASALEQVVSASDTTGTTKAEAEAQSGKDDDSADLQAVEKTKGAVAAAMSDVPADIPASKAPQAALSVSVAAETPGIPTTYAGNVAQATDEEEPVSPRLNVPRPRFWTHDSASAKAASQLTEPENKPVAAAEEPTAKKSGTETNQGELKEPPKRGPVVPPIKTDVADQSRTASRADAHLSDDEDLMEELQSATVQEAKPMVVARSPLTPVFSSPTTVNGPPGSGAPPAHTVRTVSNPSRGNLIVPTDATQSSARSSMTAGAAFLHKVTQQQQTGGNLATMKPNVGSSISQRIKALEMLSAGSGDQSRPASRERPSSTFFHVQKRETSRSPSVVDRAKSLKPTPPSPTGSQDSSPETNKVRRRRSGSVASRLSKFETSLEPSSSSLLLPGNQSRGRPESVSVTAKIIRDPNQAAGLEPPKDPSEYNYLDLKQSPLVVDHHKAVPDRTSTAIVDSAPGRRSPSLERDGKDERTRRSSLSTVKGFFKERRKSVTSSANAHQATTSRTSRSPTRPSSSANQNTSNHHHLSMSSGRSSMSKDRDSALLPSAMTEGSVSGDDKSDKKMSRAGRFMRRLSNFPGSRGKSSIPSSPPTVAEEDRKPTEESPPRAAAAAPAGPMSPSIVSDMGDVNVQFPDNLLWKRRNLSLDSQGFIILSALTAQNARPAQGTKRYHISEFRQPYTPDVEVQELPNSVVLDFVEGAGIQLACEDRTGQLHVLQSLRDAHANHSTFGQ